MTALTNALQAIAQQARRHRADSPRRPTVPAVTCTACGNLGFVRQELPPRHPEFGKALPCPRCHDSRQRAALARSLAANWPLGALERRLALKAFVQRPDAPSVTDVACSVATFARNAAAPDLMALDGPPGTGKSHLCLLAYRLAATAGLPVLYTTATTVQDRWMRFGDDPDSRREAERHRDSVASDLLAAQLLILDEAERSHGPWMENQLLQLINARRAADNKLTLLAGNHLNTLPAPLRSRLRGHGAIWHDLTNVPDARPTLE